MLGLLVNRWVIGGVVVLAVMVGAYLKGMGHGKDIIQKRWDAEKVVQERLVQEHNNRLRETERSMQKKADDIAKEKQNELEKLKRSHASIVAGLRQRPSRDTSHRVPDYPGNAESPAACTGAQLSREDSEFLVGEAARADQIRTELEACYVQYDKAKQLMGQ